MFRVTIIFSNSQEHIESIDVKFVLLFPLKHMNVTILFFSASCFRIESLFSCTGKGSWFCKTC